MAGTSPVITQFGVSLMRAGERRDRVDKLAELVVEPAHPVGDVLECIGRALVGRWHRPRVVVGDIRLFHLSNDAGAPYIIRHRNHSQLHCPGILLSSASKLMVS